MAKRADGCVSPAISELVAGGNQDDRSRINVHVRAISDANGTTKLRTTQRKMESCVVRSVLPALRGQCIHPFVADIRSSDKSAPGRAIHAERWRANCRAGDQQSTQSVPSVLPAPQLDLGGKEPNKSWNASSLAFLGDSVYELYARRRCFHPPKSAAKYREAVIQMVRAEAQSAACAKLSASGILTEAEAEVLRWGKNAPGTLPKRLERAVYRDATGMLSRSILVSVPVSSPPPSPFPSPFPSPSPSPSLSSSHRCRTSSF